MNITRKSNKVNVEKWARYKYNLTTGIGENGKRLTGCKEHIELSRKVAGEGMVLLENNGLLPLKPNTTVALFGIGSIDYVKGGGGSGMVYCEYVRNIYEGFLCKAPQISVYEPVTKYYYDYAISHLSEYDGDKLFPEIDVPNELVKEAAKNADVAIITIHRFSGEGWDRSSQNGDFYLTDTEQKMVDDVTTAFEHSVVVLNVGGMIDVSWIKSNSKIDAALLAWQAGMEGGLAITDILCGDVNPSGKLTDTFAKEFSDYPSADSFNESDDYVDYFEDIYVGYRYFETIPEAREKVNYPFGYGLSYTSFNLGKVKAEKTGEQICVSLTVTNIGNYTGKEVVQVYFSAPQGILGKSKISLAGFQKTKLLAPGESQEITITFDIADMASYDDLGKLQKSAFLLEQGEYRFLVGTTCRDLIECDYRYQVKEKYLITKEVKSCCAPNLLSRRMLSDGSFEPLPSFHNVQYTAQPVDGFRYGQTNETKPLSAVANGELTLEDFIAQMTNDELVEIVSGISNRGIANTCGWGGIDRLGIPAVMTADGPAGVRFSPKTGIATTAWPCATLVACTWNTDLAYEMGVAGGLECKENGIATWLTPALNIHRNPLCGRNFEYFSEDPLISGKFAAAKVRGIQSTNTAASAKHFAANNKETKRYYSDSRMSERALREIYLRGFEICVKESQPWTIMNSYNVINGRRTCECFELNECILRQEWGFEGMIITDWFGPCNQEHCLIAGTDVRMPSGFPDVVRDALRRKRLTREHLQQRAKKILEMILKLD